MSLALCCDEKKKSNPLWIPLIFVARTGIEDAMPEHPVAKGGRADLLYDLYVIVLISLEDLFREFLCYSQYHVYPI